MNNSCSVVYTRLDDSPKSDVSYNLAGAISVSIASGPELNSDLLIRQATVLCVPVKGYVTCTAAVDNPEIHTELEACSTVRASVVCEVSRALYLRVEPTVIWVQPEYITVTHVRSNTDWKIE